MFRVVRLSTVVVLLAGPAAAQTFPADEADWTALPCGKTLMTDPYRDESGALKERDIVGSLGAPAGFAASDDTFVYLRLRVDQDPAQGNKLQPFAWGIAISIDQDPQTYEILAMVNGKTSQVELYRNTTTTRPNDPADPADDPPVQSFPFSTHGRTEVAGGTSYGDDDDYFVVMAIPWSAFQPLGLTPTTKAIVWAGTSSSANTIDGDLACHDAAATAPSLSGASDAYTVLDPVRDSDGDGYPDRVEIAAGTDPNDPQSVPTGEPALGVDLEGGGGCGISGWGARRGAAGAPFALLALSLSLLLLLRRRDLRR
jgi:hypothetical protein